MDRLLVASLLLWSQGAISQCEMTRKGLVEDVFENQKYICPSKDKLLFTVASQMQCVGKCAREEKCRLLNFIARGKVSENNCEVILGISPETSCQILESADNWLAMKFQRFQPNKINDGGERVHASCKQIYHSKKVSVDGVYELQSGRHYCIMSPRGECGGGGWTLAMKINGSKDIFDVDSSYWQNDLVYSVDDGLKNPESVEAKYPAFSKIGFKSICIGMTYNESTNWIFINKSASSLLEIFQGNVYTRTVFGPNKWKDFITGGCLQPDCNNEGFNAGKNGGDIYVRIGIASNQKKGNGNECNKIESYIGIGTKLADTGCLQSNPGVSCGNFAMCNDPGCRRSTAAIGTILIK